MTRAFCPCPTFASENERKVFAGQSLRRPQKGEGCHASFSTFEPFVAAHTTSHTVRVAAANERDVSLRIALVRNC